MKKIRNSKTKKRFFRHKRIRAKVSGTKSMPRLSVYRSNRYFYAQLIDDSTGRTLASVSDMGAKKGTKTEHASRAGEELAGKAKEQKIEKVVFDRGGFLYAGRIKAFAEGARKGGLKF
jgi:large subunit ribosomal protein L18